METWAFYNHKPPQPNYELPNLSDTEVTMTTQTKSQKSQKYNLRSSKPISSEDVTIVDINSCQDDSNNLGDRKLGYYWETRTKYNTREQHKDNAKDNKDVITENNSQSQPENTLDYENKQKKESC